MIVPAARLLWAVGLWSLPLALLGTLLPGLAAPAVALALAPAALALLDAALTPGRLAGLAARQPSPARLTQGRPGLFEIELDNPSRRPLRLRVGLPFPVALGVEEGGETQAVTLPADAPAARLKWTVRPLLRGRHRVPACHVERRSPLGFWLGRAALALEGEARVYPDLLPERRGLAALFLPRTALGVRRRRQVGKGREFEKLREYVPGDALGDLHWKATAKRGRPITKLFQVERTQEVYLIIDASRLSARPNPGGGGPGAATVLDRYLNAALVACLAAERQGDHFGLIVFGDRVHRFIPAGSGRAHYNACRDALYTLQPRRVTPDFEELFTTVRLRLRRRALLIFLTALDDATLAESFDRGLGLIRRHHLVLVNMLAPPHARELFAAGGDEDPWSRLGGHLVWHDLRLLERSLARHGVRFGLLSHEGLVTEVVSQYLEVKQRQML